MKIKKLLSLFIGMSLSVGATAAPYTVCDFEDYEIGKSWTLWQGGANSTATVEVDPVNPSNKVLHIILRDWGCHPEFALPQEFAGKALTDRFIKVRYQQYRSETNLNAGSNADDYKQSAVFLGTQELYRDESYPYQGDRNVWLTKEHQLKPVDAGNTSNLLRLGIHHANTDYYIDNVQLVGEYDDYVEATDGQVFDYCINNNSNSYKNFDLPLYIPEGVTARVNTSRYSGWTSVLAGKGTLNIYSGGDRSYIGLEKKGTPYPDWTKMTGDVHLYPYKDVNSSCGFYGLILQSSTFLADDIDGQSRPNILFANKTLVMHSGSALAIENGTRGVRIGELQLESGAELIGYYKSGSANSYYVVGGKGTDAVLAGKIYPKNSGNKVGLIKEGKGTYTLSGNDNNINSGVMVNAGRLLVCNDAVVAKSGKKSGVTGNAGLVTVSGKARLGGNGSIAANTDVYGTLEPGTDEYSTLTFADYAGAKDVKVTLHPKSNIRINARSASEYSTLVVNGQLEASDATEDFQTSDASPRITLALADDAVMNINDEITLLTCTKKPVEAIKFDVYYPKKYTFTTEQRISDSGEFAVVAKVVSLDDNPNYKEEGEEIESDEKVYPAEDVTVDMSSTQPLRYYAEKLGKSIGVAAASYRYDLGDDADKATAAVGREFNVVVGENEMKFDATEPSKNGFSYGGSDAIMWVASRHQQEVRGHTLAWHSQVPEWVSKDGKKNDHNYTKRELLDILKNHIYNVVGNYKGKIREWDVVNEVLDDDQSCVRSNPGSYKLRPSIWSTYIGEEFIDSAFVWAHKADPDAKLYINDYGVEFMGSTKAEAYFNLVKRLQKSALPIDGCGLQCHLTTGQLDTLKLENNIKRYAPLALKCIITELDISLANPYTPNALEDQAKEFAAITRVFLRNDNCPTLMFWGISDNNSWRSNQPLLFDSNCDAKPAYYYVHAQMRKALDTATAVKRVDATAATRGGEVYDLLGRKVSADYSGIVIENGVKRVK